MKKKVLIVLVVIIVILAALLGIFHRATYLVFKNLTIPTVSLPKEDDWTGGQILKNIQYSDVSESDYLNLYILDGVEKPQLFVLIHGGGFIAGDADTKQIQLMYRYFRDHGYACASINYRLAQEAAFPAPVQDCKAAIRFLRANADVYGYDAEHIAVFGESAGGYLATMCSVTLDDEFNDLPFIGQTEENNPSARTDVLINYYGHVEMNDSAADLKAIGLPKPVYMIANNWMIGKTGGYEDFASYLLRKNVSEMTQDERNAVEPSYYLEKNASELSERLAAWTIHGDCDITVPLPVSQRLQERLEPILGENAQLRVEPGMGHASDPLYADDILAEVDEFIRAHLA